MILGGAIGLVIMGGAVGPVVLTSGPPSHSSGSSTVCAGTALL